MTLDSLLLIIAMIPVFVVIGVFLLKVEEVAQARENESQQELARRLAGYRRQATKTRRWSDAEKRSA